MQEHFVIIGDTSKKHVHQGLGLTDERSLELVDKLHAILDSSKDTLSAISELSKVPETSGEFAYLFTKLGDVLAGIRSQEAPDLGEMFAEMFMGRRRRSPLNGLSEALGKAFAEALQSKPRAKHPFKDVMDHVSGLGAVSIGIDEDGGVEIECDDKDLGEAIKAMMEKKVAAKKESVAQS